MRTAPLLRACSLALALLSVLPAAIEPAPQTIAGLGATSFQTSTQVPAAQTAFLRGLLLLHLFEYGEAAQAFTAAQHLDPAFAMAYWGEAMTFNAGVWNRLDAPAGQAALHKFAPTAAARASRISDPRERAYFAAVEILFDPASTKPDRDRRYAQAMERLAHDFPSDRNAQLFFALALLSQNEGVRDVPVYLRAAQIAQTVFRVEPHNPGAAHYWIHGMDDPDHAAGALEAARALSKIAPDAPHAQHMCSHIFMALGMWDDVVQANVEAIRVSNRRDIANGFPPRNCGHYPDWLLYSYFQQGRAHDAIDTLESCRQTGLALDSWIAAHPGQTPYGVKDAHDYRTHLAQMYGDMQGMAAIESRGLKAAPTSPLPWSAFVNGLLAAQAGRLPDARAAVTNLRHDIEALPQHDEERAVLHIAADELEGLLRVKEGNPAGGIAQLRQAADTYRKMPFAFGPPVTIKPPEELLGEVLLDTGDAPGASLAFRQALERAPGRTTSLLGLARAQSKAGDHAAARKTYAQLVIIWHAADSNTPGLKEAQLLSQSRDSGL